MEISANHGPFVRAGRKTSAAAAPPVPDGHPSAASRPDPDDHTLTVDVEFLEARPVWALWREAHAPIPAGEVEERLRRGDSRLEVRTADSQVPVRLASLEDLQELSVFTGQAPAGSLPHPDLARGLQQLALQGWRLVDAERGEIGLYGAYNSLTAAASVIARRGDVDVPLDDPESPARVARFYDPARGERLADLEQAGYRFFSPAGGRVPACQAGAGHRVGLDGEAWVRVEELPAGLETRELARFAALRGEAASAVEAARAWRLDPTRPALERFDEVLSWSRDPRAVRLALLAAPPTPAQRLQRLPELVKSHGESAGAAIFASLEGEPGCQVQAALARQWAGQVRDPKARALLFTYLAETPLPSGDLAARHAAAVEALNRLSRGGADRSARGAFAAGWLEHLGSQPLTPETAGFLAEQVPLSVRQAGVPCCLPVLELVRVDPGAAGVRQIWEDWEPALPDKTSRACLAGELLKAPLMHDDLGARHQLARQLVAEMSRQDVPRKDRARFAGFWLDRLLQQPLSASTAALVAEQARAAARLGDDQARGRALAYLEALPEAAGIRAIQADWQAALGTPAMQASLEEQLLTEPLLADDLARRHRLAQEVVREMSRQDVARSQRAGFARFWLERLMREPLTPEIAAMVGEQARLAAALGDVAARERALTHLERLPETAGMRAVAADWMPVLPRPEMKAALQEQLLQDVTLADSLPRRHQLAEDVLKEMSRQDVSRKDRGGFADFWLEQLLLPENHPEAARTVASQAAACARLGNAQARRRTLDAVGTPVARAILADWLPLAATEPARETLRELVLSHWPESDTPQVRQQLLEALPRLAVGMDVPSKERAALVAAITAREKEHADRRQVEAMTRPDRAQLVEERDASVIVGGVPLKKHDPSPA